jgi:5'-3' exoribonuclease 2
MGVPILFKWMSTKYPKITSRVIEELPSDVTTTQIDSSKANPNALEIDNLYLDMNGIIHPCCHPQVKSATLTEDEMFVEIFKYIDRIFNIVRPRKLLYLAIGNNNLTKDGVAPRAKMVKIR